MLYGGTVNVETVMVDGKILKQDGRMVGVDVGAVLDEAQRITMEVWEGLYADRPELRNLS